MYKYLTLLGMLTAGITLAAAEPLLQLRSRTPADLGKCRLIRQEAVKIQPDGFDFGASNSFIHLKTPEKLVNATFALQVKPVALCKQDAAFLGRRGFHNILGMDKNNLPFFELWGLDRQKRLRITGKTPLAPEKWYNLAAVIRCDENQTGLELYVDGKREAAGKLAGKPYAYDPELIIGSSNPYGKNFRNEFSGKVNHVQVWAEALSPEDVAELARTSATISLVHNGTLSIADFGAIPNDGKDDTAAVHRAIDFAIENGAKRLVFPRGTYDFYESRAANLYDKSHWVFFLNHVDDFEIDGGGSRFILHGLQFLILTRECSRLTLKNMTIDYARPFFSIGKVTALAPDRRSFEIDVDPLYPVFGGEKVEAFLEMDPATGLPANPGLDVYYRITRTELVSHQKLRAHMSDTINVLPGKTILLRHDLYTASLMRFLHGADIQLKHLTVFMASGMGIVGQYIKNFSVSDVHIRPRPGSGTPMSIPSDGLNLLGCSGKITVEKCTFDGMGDDGMNIFSNFWVVREIVDDHTCIIANPRFQSREVPQEKPGNIFEFLQSDNFNVYAARTIKTLEPDWKHFNARVTFTEPLPKELKINDDVLMTRNRPEEIIIRDNFFRPLRGRGITLQTSHAWIENNQFADSASSGIHISTTLSPWFEASPVQNVMIRNNVFRNCMRKGASKNSAVIQISASLRDPKYNDLMHDGTPAMNGVHRNIRILNNKILGSNNGGMVISSVKNVEIRGNILQDLSQAPEPTWINFYQWSKNAVTMLGAHQIVFADNRYICTTTPSRPGIIAVGEKCDDIKLENNQNFEEKRGSVFP